MAYVNKGNKFQDYSDILGKRIFIIEWEKNFIRFLNFRCVHVHNRRIRRYWQRTLNICSSSKGIFYHPFQPTFNLTNDDIFIAGQDLFQLSPRRPQCF